MVRVLTDVSLDGKLTSKKVIVQKEPESEDDVTPKSYVDGALETMQTTLSGQISDLSGQLSAETSSRETKDSELEGLITSKAESSAVTQLEGTVSELGTQVTGLSSTLSSEIGRVDTELTGKVSQSTYDSDIQGINNQISQRPTATEVSQEIDADVSALRTELVQTIGNLEAELDDKVTKETGKGLSTNDYTTGEKTKLGGIASGAQVNVIETVKVNNTALGVSGKAVNIDLSNYATKSDLSSIPRFAISVVTNLPTSNISTTTIYLVSNSGSGTNVYDEYIYVNSKWERIGTLDVNLTDYSTKSETVKNLSASGKTITITKADGTTDTITTQDTNTTYDAGTGLSLSGTTFNHSNSVTANTSGVGSATAVPVIKYDAQGHITSITTATIYPPTSAGTSGQYWKSDGSGAGVWQSLDTSPTANSTNAITSGAVKSALDGKLATTGTAAKATADASGNNIVNTYAKKTDIPDVSGFETKANAITGLSVSGKVITYTKGDGSTGTITTQDTNDNNKTAQTHSTTNAAYPILLKNGTGTGTVTNGAIFDADATINPSTGVITAPGFAGPLTGDVTGNCSGSSGSCTGNAATATQFSANKTVALTGDVTGSASAKAGWSVATTLAASGVTAGSYGPSANASPASKGTFSVPYITVDAKGRVTAASTKTITLPTDTTYSVATTSANGLMSSTDKSKLDGIATGANKTTVDSALSSSSTNPVQNKVINSALSGKANSSHTHSEYLPLAGGKVTGPTSFTGTVGNTQTEAGVYLGLDTNADAPNANMAIVSANTAAYIDMGAPNEDYGFRIIKWKGLSGDVAQFVYGGGGSITVPNATGTLALTSQIPTYSAGTNLALSSTTFNYTVKQTTTAIDSLTTSGNYWASSYTINGTSGYWYIEVIQMGDANHILQRATLLSDPSNVIMRSRNGSTTWSAWYGPYAVWA